MIESSQPLSTRRQRKLKWNKSTYRDLLKCKVPQLSKLKSGVKPSREKLFSVEIVEKEESRVNVHYIGFSNEFDEWKDESEVEVLHPEELPAWNRWLISHFLCMMNCVLK